MNITHLQQLRDLVNHIRKKIKVYGKNLKLQKKLEEQASEKIKGRKGALIQAKMSGTVVH